MVHQGQGLAFRLESGDHTPGVHPELDDLKRHPAAKRLLLLGHVNHTATAFADLLEEFVAADAVAGLFGGGNRQMDAGIGVLRRYSGREPRRSERRLLEKITRLIVGLKQGLDAVTQLGVTVAHLVEIGDALHCRQLQGRVEHDHFAIGGVIHLDAA